MTSDTENTIAGLAVVILIPALLYGWFRLSLWVARRRRDRVDEDGTIAGLKLSEDVRRGVTFWFWFGLMLWLPFVDIPILRVVALVHRQLNDVRPAQPALVGGFREDGPGGGAYLKPDGPYAWLEKYVAPGREFSAPGGAGPSGYLTLRRALPTNCESRATGADGRRFGRLSHSVCVSISVADRQQAEFTYSTEDNRSLPFDLGRGDTLLIPVLNVTCFRVERRDTRVVFARACAYKARSWMGAQAAIRRAAWFNDITDILVPSVENPQVTGPPLLPHARK